MKTYLIIDSGNTHLKFAKFDQNGNLLESSVCKSLQEIKFDSNTSGIFCSVNHEAVDLPLNILNFESLQLNFKSNYSKSLGHDRLAICHYLQNLHQEKTVIVDAGSFTTIDILNNGIHEGGLIYPGVNNFLSSYYEKGKNLPKLEYKPQDSKIGQTTESAILAATTNYIESIKQLINKVEAEHIYITGGDRDIFSIENAIVDKDLLFKSLFFILKQQE